jgi:hypothetical protein
MPTAQTLSPQAVAAFQKLQAVRARLVQTINKAADNVGRLSRESLPPEIIKVIERKINREGWMEKILDKRFSVQAQRSYGKGKWKPLRPATVRQRGSSRPILIDTGEMYFRSIDAVRNTFRFNRPVQWDVADIGVDYAEYHMTGTDKMVARPFFYPPDAKELRPVYRRAFQIAREELRKRAQGGNINAR